MHVPKLNSYASIPPTGCEADEIARKEPVVKLGRSSAADSQRFVSNADGSYTACPAALASGARIEHCFMTKAGERVRLIQLLSSADEGEGSIAERAVAVLMNHPDLTSVQEGHKGCIYVCLFATPSPHVSIK